MDECFGNSLDDITDGLLSQEQEDLVDRVAYLEKKVTQQGDEIVCLKSALADVIRRISQLESAPPNHVLPSKPTFRSPRKSASHERKSHLNPLENVNLISHRSTTPPQSRSYHSSRNSTPLKKWSSLSNSADLSNSQITPNKRLNLQANGDRRSISHSNLNPRPVMKGSREPVWNTAFEDGYLKIYIRGRPIMLYAPSTLTDYNLSKIGETPSETLQVEWVYGYRGRDCRSNLYNLPTGELVYFIAAVVVLYNVEENMQRHYLGHSDDVKCIAIHPDKIRIATGQVAGHDKKEGKKKRNSTSEVTDYDEKWPHIRIWDSVSLNTLNVIGLGDFDRAVCCVSFSKLDGGLHLVAVDDANEHVISVWDLSRDKPHKITETKSSTEPVLAVEYHPQEKNSIVSCGKSQITFWTVEGGSLAKKQGIFDKHDKPKYVLCLAFADNGDVISGDSNGNIFIWGKGSNRISQAINGAHEGGVFSVCVMKDGSILSGGGKDRKVIQWDSTYKRTGLETEIPEVFGPVRTLGQGKGNLILVGTTRNSVLQGTLDLKLNPIVQGHMDELWGLATHPTQHQFLSCGSDKHIYLWDSMSHSVIWSKEITVSHKHIYLWNSMSHSVIWSKEITDPAHSCCFHPNGCVAAIGTHAARWLIVDLATREIVSVHSDGSEQIETIKYSPDGSYIAIGSRDNYIYVYQVSDGGRKYSKVGRCSGHSSFITHVDWSEDSQYLVSNSGDYEVLYWTVSSCKQVTTPASLRDIQWASQDCTLGFNVAGIWPDGADGTDINNCTRSHKQHLVATGDDFGKVNLFKYPSCQPKSSSHVCKGHSSHVTDVGFLFDDSRLISTGGRDMSIIQWEVIG
ncbi:echinoderm microtubule-associated protein-like 2 isoform X13 [Haliotis rubra]|uniref:echinoderm microtubule-associated protein-like 2 isoform X13 n=1 Tax=Haliotis rubra TaxID=36100 RepID=UPI001EE5BC4B|nr:echinoderm microtubule-associated protein-like 2 isoform X13 [Haliotis rubra]